MTQIYRPMIVDRHGHAGERERWFKPNCPLLSRMRVAQVVKTSRLAITEPNVDHDLHPRMVDR